MKLNTKIAGINVTFSGYMDDALKTRLIPYKANFMKSDITIDCKLSENIVLPENIEIIKVTNDRTWFYWENKFCFADYNGEIEKYLLFVAISGNSAEVIVYNLENQKEIELITVALREYKRRMPNIKEREEADTVVANKDCMLINATDRAIRYVLLYHKVFSVHSSAIAYNGYGIIFSAPSGTGKSTHTALWEKYYNAEIINDDSPLISVSENTVTLHGSPWAGSTGININKSVPLKAIVFLQQAPENSIEPMSVIQALQFLLRELIKPCDAQLMDNVYTLLNLLLASVPCYLLKCTPDKEAADVVYNELFEKN